MKLRRMRRTGDQQGREVREGGGGNVGFHWRAFIPSFIFLLFSGSGGRDLEAPGGKRQERGNHHGAEREGGEEEGTGGGAEETGGGGGAVEEGAGFLGTEGAGADR